MAGKTYGIIIDINLRMSVLKMKSLRGSAANFVGLA